jgi:hypothetical protein
VVVAREFPGTLIRLSATGGEEDAIEIARGETGQSLGQLNGLGVCVGPGREEAEFADLRGCGVSDVAAPVSERVGEESGQTVKILGAVRVVDPRTFAAHHDGNLIVLVVRAQSRHL